MATIGGARGILVVGGATGEDLVEFMDWDDQTQWTTLGKLNRGRGIHKNNTLQRHPHLKNQKI
jgi:hypothetical protein